MNWMVTVEMTVDGNPDTFSVEVDGASAVSALQKVIHGHKLAFASGDIAIKVTQVSIGEAGEEVSLPEATK
jgi:hypothetical protein